MFSRLISYPVFRLTVAGAAGIVVTDRLMVRQECLCMLAGLFVCVLAAAFVVHFFSSYRYRAVFGMLVTLAVGLAGGVSVLLHRGEIRYDWVTGERIYIGQLDEAPRIRSKTRQALVRVEAGKDSLSGEWKAVDRKILLSWVSDSLQPSLRCGDRILFRTVVEASGTDSSRTGFDYGRYLERQGVSGTAIAFSGNWRKLTGEIRLTLRQRALRLREQVVDIYRSWNLEEDVLAVVSALTVGDKSELSRELRATYSTAGASHVLALSGLHVGVLALLLSALLYPLRWLREGRRIILFVVAVFLWGFAFLSGLSASVVRAVTMFSLYVLFTSVSGGRHSGVCSWSLSAFLMLVYNPFYLFDISFQLSFVAVFALLFFYPLVSNLWHPCHRVARFIWQVTALSVSAQIGTLPFVAHYFGTFPTYFIISNLVVTPLASVILFFALLSLLLLPVPVLCGWSVSVLSAATRLMSEGMKVIQGLSGVRPAEFYFSEGQGWLFALSVCFLAAYFYYRRPARYLILTLVTAACLLGSMAYGAFSPPVRKICMSRSQVFLQTSFTTRLLSSPSGIYRIGGRCVVKLSDGYWKHYQSAVPLKVDCLYLCRGFQGGINHWQRVFQFHTVVVDKSLSNRQKLWIRKICEEQGLTYIDISEKGYYCIPL